MPIHAVCPECRAAYDLADEQRGKKVRCKKCDHVFVAVASAKAAREEPVRQVEAVIERPSRALPKKALPATPRRTRDEEDHDREDRRRPIARKKSGALGPILLIGGLATVGVVVIAGTVALIIGLRYLGKDEDKVLTPHVASEWNPGDQGGRVEDNAKQNKPPEKDPEEPPEDNKPVREPVVKDVPPDPNAKPVPGAPGQLPPDVLRKVKRATAYIHVTLPDGRQASGSGFFAVEPNVLLTNAHVVGMLRPENRPPKNIEVVLDSGEKTEQRFGARILGVDRDADLAVLKTVLRDDQTSGTIPKPLDVKSGADLLETQELFVFGFPYGEGLGKEITVRKSSVASLRKDSSGELDKVQVHGGMDPGNSGGPVVDSNGAVVGVAVSGITGTQINFAIPGERVRSLLGGRIKEMGLGQPYQQDSQVVMQVTINLLDPLNRVSEVALDVWTGDENKPRPPAVGEEPKALPGDSPRGRAKLTYVPHKASRKGDAIGTAKGEIVLPPLPQGKTYYVQPFWMSSAGVKKWASGDARDLRPVERKPIRLVLQQQKGGDRTLMLETDESRMIRAEGGRGVDQKVRVVAQIREKTTDVTQAGATLALQYTKVTLSETHNGQGPPEEVAKHQKNLAGYMSKVTAGLAQDPKGNLQQSPAQVQGVPVASQQEVLSLNIQMMQVLEAMAVPVPNAEVKYGERWTANRTLPLSARETSGIRFVALTYTYLGTRKNAAGREEAVIGLEGKFKAIAPQEPADSGGKASGTAFLDIATGQLTQAEVHFSTDTAITEDLKLAGTLTAKLKRTGP